MTDGLVLDFHENDLEGFVTQILGEMLLILDSGG